MAKYHRDPVATFRGWNDAWLSPAFRDWNLGEFLPGISSPTLLVQGEDDQFGTLAQLDSIERQVSGPTRRLVLSESGHSPHLVQPDIVTEAVIDFLTTIP
jgi:pimeloyl-ACP methyl ester carboxylesterase